MCRSPCWGPGGCRPTWAAAAERGFVLPESVSVGCSEPGRAGTEKPCFLEYKICSLPSLPGPRRAALPSLEDQRPGPFLPPSPPLKLPQTASTKRRLRSPSQSSEAPLIARARHPDSLWRRAWLRKCSLKITALVTRSCHPHDRLLIPCSSGVFSLPKYPHLWGGAGMLCKPKRRAALGKGDRLAKGQGRKPGSEVAFPTSKQVSVTGEPEGRHTGSAAPGLGSNPHGITLWPCGPDTNLRSPDPIMVMDQGPGLRGGRPGLPTQALGDVRVVSPGLRLPKRIAESEAAPRGASNQLCSVSRTP